jgi:hypothetical protein
MNLPPPALIANFVDAARLIASLVFDGDLGYFVVRRCALREHAGGASNQARSCQRGQLQFCSFSLPRPPSIAYAEAGAHAARTKPQFIVVESFGFDKSQTAGDLSQCAVSDNAINPARSS